MRRAVKITLVAIVFVAAAGWLIPIVVRSQAGVYRTFPSPDGSYRVVVYRIPMLFGFPGQSGDASGFVRLYDRSNRVLHQTNVDMVSTVDRVEWAPKHVDVTLIAGWDLP